MKNKKVLTLLSLLILVGCSEGPPAKKSIPSYNNTSARNQIGYGDSSQRNNQTKTENSKEASISESSPIASQTAETTAEPQSETLSSPTPEKEKEKEEESKDSAASPWWLSLVAPSTLKQIVPIVNFGTFRDVNEKLRKKFEDDYRGKKDTEDSTCSAKLRGFKIRWKWKNVQERGKKANERTGEVSAILEDGKQQAEKQKVRDAITYDLLDSENPADRYKKAQELLRFRNNGPHSLLPHPQTSR